MKISVGMKFAILFLSMSPVLEAADKPSLNQQSQEKAKEIIARDQKGESLENIVEREINQQKKSKPPVSATTAVPAGESIQTGPSRLEIWKKQHEQKKVEAEEKQP